MQEFIIKEDFPKNEIEFDARFLDEQACYEYLFQCRWPEGFICKSCGHNNYWKSARGLYICTSCEQHHSLTAGTIFHGTRKALPIWFKAMWWFTTRNTSISALCLQKLLGLRSYTTAWTWLQKLRSCTIRKDREKLSGEVEVDEFYIGGKHSGNRGRGAGNKCAVVVAVELNGHKLGRVRLQVIGNCSSNELLPFIETNVVAASSVVTDGWKGYSGLQKSNYRHEQIFQTKTKDKASVLPGVHMIASLIKRLILGTYQGRPEKKYLQKYLDEYVFRFNRSKSKSVGKCFFRIVQQSVNSVKISRKQIVSGTISPLLVN